MKFKPGVSIVGIQPELVLGLVVAERAFHAVFPFQNGYEMVVTSVCDGEHRPGSLHYLGRAADLRCNCFGETDVRRWHAELTLALVGLGFDVVWEDRGAPNEHLHLEHDPRPKVGTEV
jgi:hypothetical protein